MGYRWNTARLDLLNQRVPQIDQDTAPTTGDIDAVEGGVYVCTNTSAATVTLPASPKLNARIGVIRVGTTLTIDGNGNNINQEATQDMPSVNDHADMIFTSQGWFA